MVRTVDKYLEYSGTSQEHIFAMLNYNRTVRTFGKFKAQIQRIQTEHVLTSSDLYVIIRCVYTQIKVSYAQIFADLSTGIEAYQLSSGQSKPFWLLCCILVYTTRLFSSLICFTVNG